MRRALRVPEELKEGSSEPGEKYMEMGSQVRVSVVNLDVEDEAPMEENELVDDRR